MCAPLHAAARDPPHEPAKDVRDVRGEGARVADMSRPDVLSTLGARVAAVVVLVSAVPLVPGEAVSGLQGRTRTLCAPRASRTFGWSNCVRGRRWSCTKGAGSRARPFRAVERNLVLEDYVCQGVYSVLGPTASFAKSWCAL